MKLRYLMIILLPLFIPMLSHAEWKPTGYNSWQDSNDHRKRKVLLGGTVQNYMSSKNKWAEIDNRWKQVNDTIFKIENANLTVTASMKANSVITFPGEHSEMSLEQQLQRLVLVYTVNDSIVPLFDSPIYTQPVIDSNSLQWEEIFYGVDYALLKENGVLHHRIYFRPEFLDSLENIVTGNNILNTVSLGTLSRYRFHGLNRPDPNRKDFRNHVLYNSKHKQYQIHQQQLFYPNHEDFEPVPVYQKWVTESGEYFCIELVSIASLLEVHSNYPGAKIYHNASETFEADDVSDTYVRTDNGSNENYNFGINGTILLATELDGTAKRGCFLKFDLSSITDAVTVDSTTLHIAVVQQGDSIGLGRMITEWSEGNVNSGAVDAEGEYGATWLQAKDSLGTSNDWDWANNVEFSASDFDDNNGNYFGVVDAELTSWNAYLHVGEESEGNNSMLVSDWINGRESNYGYCLIDMDLATGTTLRPKEVVISGFRPYLYIEYTVDENQENVSLRRRRSQKGVIND